MGHLRRCWHQSFDFVASLTIITGHTHVLTVGRTGRCGRNLEPATLVPRLKFGGESKTDGMLACY